MNKSKAVPISSWDLRVKNKKCLNDVAESSSDFHYFTSLHTAEKILSGTSENYIYVSPISGMNDVHERELHSKNGRDVFGLCFCNSDIDNIPMWYLYGGISGEGARIGITKTKMRDLIANIDHIYAVNDNKLGQCLKKDVDFTFEYGWIFYRNDEGMVEYRNRRYALIDMLEEFERENYFVKDTEWNYEKEFRIVFHVYGSPPEKIALPLNKKLLMRQNGGLKVMLAPELKFAKNEEKEKEKYANLFGLPAQKVSFSKLKIKMDLIARNRYTIVERFSEVISTLEAKNTTKICEQMQKASLCVEEKQAEPSYP